MSYEVECPPGRGVAFLDLPEASHGLLDGKHLHSAPLLVEVLEEGHHDLFVTRRARLEHVIEHLRTRRYAGGDNRRRRTIAPQHRGGAVVVIHRSREALRRHQQHVVRQALRAHVREHVHRYPHARTRRVDVESGHLHPERISDVTCIGG